MQLGVAGGRSAAVLGGHGMTTEHEEERNAKAGVRCPCNGFCRAHECEGITDKVWRKDGVNMGSQQKHSSCKDHTR